MKRDKVNGHCGHPGTRCPTPCEQRFIKTLLKYASDETAGVFNEMLVISFEPEEGRWWLVLKGRRWKVLEPWELKRYRCIYPDFPSTAGRIEIACPT